MTDPNTPPVAPPPGYGQPAPAPAPVPAAAAPAKKKSPLRLIGSIVVVLLVIGLGAYRFVIGPMLTDAKYTVGACLDDDPNSTVVRTEVNVVDCGSPEALSRIIAVLEDVPLNSARTMCPEEWVAALEYKAQSPFGKDKILCTVEA